LPAESLSTSTPRLRSTPTPIPRGRLRPGTGLQAQPAAYPYSEEVDFAGDVPDSEKHVVIIRHFDGTQIRYILAKSMLTEFSNFILLAPDDEMVASFPLVPAAAVSDEAEIVVETVVDLAQKLPDNEVYVYVVWSPPGTYTQYLVPKEQVRTTELRHLLDLAPTDQLIRAYSLVGLPQRPRVSEDLSVALVASETHCTKFDLALCDRMTTLRPNEQVDVAIWLRDINYSLAYDIIAPTYPAIQPQRHRPFDPTHPAYENAFVQLETLIGHAYGQRAKSLLFLLRQLGVENAELSPWAPVVTATLSPEALLALTGFDEVINVHLLPEGR
jgi:hypothetical protein